MNFLRKTSSQQRNNLSKITKRTLNSSNLPKQSLHSPLTHGVHVFHCPDAVGIVAKLSECIASRGGNILNADIFVPENNRVFYSRSEFVFDPSKWPREQMDDDFLKIGKMFNAMKSVVRVCFVCFEAVDLLHAWHNKRLPVDITCVISNHFRDSDSHAVRFLEQHQIPYYFLNTTEVNKRDDEILDLVQNTDFLLATCRYGRDVINIHHGLLPSFKGGNPSRQAFDCGVKMIGATTHFVTEELDAGPIIEQMVERVSHRDNLQSFVQKSETREKQCLSKAIKYYCELRVLPYSDNKTVVF